MKSQYLICGTGDAAFTTKALVSTQTINTYTLKGREGSSLHLSTPVASEATSKGRNKAIIKKSDTSNDKKSFKSSKKPQNPSKKRKISALRSTNQRDSSNKSKQNTKSFKPLKDLKLGSSVSGKVVDICDFGVFVDIGRTSRPALLHISQIRNDKIDNIRDVFKVGDVIEGARVINVDLAKGEVGLSLRQQRPKRKHISAYKVGDKIVGRVDTVLPYGAFIDVGANVNPLLHISRITGSAVENIRHYVNEGDSVPVHVIDVNPDRKTMAVSMLDKKADQYLDRRMSQKMKRFFGTAKEETVKVDDESELDYFDKAIRELEDALKER